MRPTGDLTKTTGEVIDRFNRAFMERDATLLADIIAPDCVMESAQPAPDGSRYEGYDAPLSSWKALVEAADYFNDRADCRRPRELTDR